MKTRKLKHSATDAAKEIRTIALDKQRLEIRAADGEGMPTLVGYAAVFGVQADLGWFVEEVVAGAFSRSLAEGADVRAFWNHSTDHVLGRRSANTLRLQEDATGLRVEIDLPDTTAARDLVANIEAGNVDGMSFGFRAREVEWVERMDEPEIRRIIDADLIEVSAVTFPAYADTSIAKRSLEAARAEHSHAGPNSEERAEARCSDEVYRLRARRNRR